MQRLWRMLLVVAPLTGFLAPSVSAGLKVKLQLFVDGLIHPMQMLTAPDGTKRRFSVEQSGMIVQLLPDGKVRPAPFLDLTDRRVRLNREFDERGLLGMAFHPNFKDNGKFYVVYSGPVSSDAPRCVQLHFAADVGQNAYEEVDIIKPWFVYNTLGTDRPGTAMPSWVERFSHAELWQLTALVASLGDQAHSGSR